MSQVFKGWRVALLECGSSTAAFRDRSWRVESEQKRKQSFRTPKELPLEVVDLKSTVLLCLCGLCIIRARTLSTNFISG